MKLDSITFLSQFPLLRDGHSFFLRGSHPGGGGGEVLPGILGGGVPPGSSNPDPISDLNMPFSTPVFRPEIYASVPNGS